MKIIRERSSRWAEEFFLFFERVKFPGSGYHFPCNEQGELLQDRRNNTSDMSYAECLKSSGVFRDPSVQKSRWRIIDFAIGRCDCGREVELRDMENSCTCGRTYSVLGQALRPRMINPETGQSIPYEDEGLEYDRETDAWAQVASF